VLAPGLHRLGALGVDRGDAEADAVGGLACEQQVRGTQESCDESRGGLRVQVVGVAHLEQPPMIHDANRIGQRKGFFLIVRHQDRGDPELALHRADGPPQFFADLCIQRAERFVQQQNLRLVGQGSCNGHALLLASGQLARQALVHAFEGHQLEQFLAAGTALGRLRAPDAQREFDVVGHRHVAEQRVVLEHEPDPAVTRAHVGYVAPVQGDSPVIDAGEAGDGP
jgi:hypothetical protein